MRALLAGLVMALLAVASVKAAPIDPYITLDTPGPYHYGGTISVTTHGDIHHTSRLQMFCYQGGTLVYVEAFDASDTETTYTLHFGVNGGSNDWNGGAADCQIRFSRVGHGGTSFEPYTVIDTHVEA